MATLRDWLTFLRIHTSCLTQAGTVLGAILGGVTNIPLLLLYGLFGLLYHAWGFTDNNIKDFEYDQKDPAKQHFALIKGSIPLSKAKVVNWILLIMAFAVGIFFVRSATELLIPLVLLVVAFASGMTYNIESKRSLLSPIYITIAFTCLPLFTYFTATSVLSPTIVLVAIYTTLLIIFQIAFEGYLKDIESDPVNLLRKWGAMMETFTVETFIKFGKQLILWRILKMLNFFVGLILWWIVSSDGYALGIYLFLWIMGAAIFSILTDTKYDNKSVVKNASRMEIVTYTMLIVALQGILGWITTSILVIYPIAWFMVLNRLTWGKGLLTPKV